MRLVNEEALISSSSASTEGASVEECWRGPHPPSCVFLVGVTTVTTRNNIRASSVVALYSMSTISELTCKSRNTFI
jgi:hypothetical protein